MTTLQVIESQMEIRIPNIVHMATLSTNFTSKRNVLLVDSILNISVI